MLKQVLQIETTAFKYDTRTILQSIKEKNCYCWIVQIRTTILLLGWKKLSIFYCYIYTFSGERCLCPISALLCIVLPFSGGCSCSVCAAGSWRRYIWKSLCLFGSTKFMPWFDIFICCFWSLIELGAAWEGKNCLLCCRYYQ